MVHADGVPTVFQQDGFRFFFFSEEGTEPPHVHVRKGKPEIKLWVTPTGVTVARVIRMAPHDQKRAIELANANISKILERWHAHFRNSNR